MNKKYALGIALGVILPILTTSCGGLKDTYKAPDLPQNMYRGDTSTDTTTIASIPWRTYFSDPKLQSLIDEGLANSFDLQIAALRVNESQAYLGQAKGAFFPAISLGTQAKQARTSTANDLLTRRTENYSLGLTASWELDAYGKLFNAKRAAVDQFLGTIEYHRLVQTVLISNIATSYYTLLSLDQQLKVTKQSVKLLSETVETMKALKEAAIMNGAAVVQSEASLYAAEVTIPDLEAQIRTQENAICLLIGRVAGDIDRSTIDDQTVRIDVSHGIPSQMLAHRPDVKQAEYALRAAFEFTGIAKGNMYPSINISGTIAYATENGIANFFKPENIIANLLGGITQPLFMQGQLKANLKIAQAQQQEAVLAFRKSVLNAGNEVSNELSDYQLSMSKNDIRKKQVEALLTAVDFTKELLKSGDASYIDVLSAEQNLLQAQLGQASDKLQALTATVNLYRALGGGLK